MSGKDSIKPKDSALSISNDQKHYSLLFHANKHLGRIAIASTYMLAYITNSAKLIRRSNRKAKALSKDEIINKKRLKELKTIAHRSNEILAQVSNVLLPVNLFPDTIVLDRTKVTITKRALFWDSSIVTVGIEDILDIAISNGPFFSTLNISSRVMSPSDSFKMKYLLRKDAIRLKSLIIGYMTAIHNDIKTKDLSRSELIDTLLEIGSDSG